MRDYKNHENLVECFLCKRLTQQQFAFARRFEGGKATLFRCMLCETENRINQRNRPAIVIVAGELGEEVASHARA